MSHSDRERRTLQKIMMIAGEISGDMHASHLIKELLSEHPELSIFGIGGQKMQQAGANIKYNIVNRSTIGFIEFFRHLPYYLWLKKQATKMLKEQKPDLLILIDFQGFNMIMAGIAKNLGIKTLYYIAPQDWLWGNEKSMKHVTDTLTNLIAIFEDEYQIYKKVANNVHYFGHPLMDIAKCDQPKEEIRKKYNLDNNKKVIAIFPGSRSQELKHTFPEILKTIEELDKLAPQKYQYILNAPNEEILKRVSSKIGTSPNPLLKEGVFMPSPGRSASTLSLKRVIMTYDDSYAVLKAADFVIATSGTISLEAGIIGTPMAILYKFNALSYFIAKYIIKVKLPFIALPNLIMKKKIVAEYLQNEVKPTNIALYINKILDNEIQYSQLKSDLGLLQEKLGKKGVLKKVARLILTPPPR